MEEASAIDQRARPSPLPRVVRFRFQLEAVEPILLPAYPGSVWRGLLGLGLRRTACLTHQPTCDGCLLRHACVYSVLFESPAQDPADAPRYKELPHPFALEIPQSPQREVGAGDPITLGINLIGPAIEQMPYLIHAMQTAGRHGAGQTRGRFMLAALERETHLGDADWMSAYRHDHGQYLPPGPATTTPPPPAPDSVRIRLDTPLRLKRRGHLVGPTELDAQDLLLNLCARLGLLASHYGGDPAAFDWGRLRTAAQTVEIDKDPGLHWHDWTRYSGRQQESMKMGGLLGDVQLHGTGLSAFWPALWHGQWVHLGKGTSFGLGAYRVEGESW